MQGNAMKDAERIGTINQAMEELKEAAALLYKAEANLGRAGLPREADAVDTVRRSLDSNLRWIMDRLQNGEGS